MEKIDFQTWLINRIGNTDSIRQYLRCETEFKKEGHQLNENSIERYISKHPHIVARTFLKHYLKYNHVNLEVPRKAGRKPSKIYRKLSKYEINQIIDIAPPKISLMVRLYFDTGLRLNELIKRQKKDFNLETRSVYGIGKGNKEFEEKYSPTTANILKEYLNSYNPEDHPFHFQGITRHEAKFQYELKKIKKILGLPRLTPHMIRHALGHYLRAEKGFDLSQIKAKLRHTKLETTQIYAAASREEVDKKIDQEVFN